MTGRVPLDRALSKMGLASRTDARALIVDGRVTVDGVTITDPRRLVRPERQRIAIHRDVAPPPARRLIVFHKPRGLVTTRRDPEGRKTVFDALGSAGDGLQAVGRLDQASTGLLLFTNDTRLADQLTDPARAIPREYVVTVRGRLDDLATKRLCTGLDVAAARGRTDEGSRTERLTATTVTILKASSRESHAIVTLTEGKNRELRRMFEALGHEVTRVHRIRFGPFELGTLQPGEWREAPLSLARTATTDRRPAGGRRARTPSGR